MDEQTRKAFTDAWNIYKKFYACSKDDTYWEALLQAEISVIAAYEDKTLIKGLFTAINTDIENRLRHS